MKILQGMRTNDQNARQTIAEGPALRVNGWSTLATGLIVSCQEGSRYVISKVKAAETDVKKIMK